MCVCSVCSQVNSLWRLLDTACERYLTFCDSYEASDKHLEPLIDKACVVFCLYLESDDYHKAVIDIEELAKERELLLQEKEGLLKDLAQSKLAVKAEKDEEIGIAVFALLMFISALVLGILLIWQWL